MRIQRQVIFLGLLIIVACFLALISIPFSHKEGYYGSYDEYYQQLNNATTVPKASGNTNSDGCSFKGWDYSALRNALEEKEKSSNVVDTQIKTNAEFLSVITKALGVSPSNASDDLAAIYRIEPRIAGLNTENAKKLLAEMGSPRIAKTPRVFLQYMNWYATKCPIDSNTCIKP